MAIDTTIIPRAVDLSTEADETTIEYRNINGVTSSKKLTVGDLIIYKIAEGELRSAVLETNASITGATTSLEDIMTDSTGLLNTVTTATTTSIYDNTNKVYTNPTIININPEIITGTDNDVEKHAFYVKVDGLKLKSFSFEAYTSTTTEITLSKDGSVIKTIPSASYVGGNKYTITFNQELVKDSEYIIRTVNYAQIFYVKQSSYYNGTYIKQHTDLNYKYMLKYDANNYYTFEFLDQTTASEKEIVLSYNKAKPTALYFAPYSSSTDVVDVGDVTISLYKDATLLGTYEPYTIYEGLSLADTPNKAVITQADTAISKIYQYVLLIE